MLWYVDDANVMMHVSIYLRRGKIGVWHKAMEFLNAPYILLEHHVKNTKMPPDSEEVSPDTPQAYKS